MTKTIRTEDERLNALYADIGRLQAKAKEIAANKRAKETRTAQRRAFLIGEAILAVPDLPDPFKTQLATILDRHAKRPADREVLGDLLNLSNPSNAKGDEAAA